MHGHECSKLHPQCQGTVIMSLGNQDKIPGTGESHRPISPQQAARDAFQGKKAGRPKQQFPGQQLLPPPRCHIICARGQAILLMFLVKWSCSQETGKAPFVEVLDIQGAGSNQQ